MTDPILAGGGRTITVTHAPVMLTEYAPVTVINAATTARVWLAASSSVSPGSGVPLDAGTSYDWATAGQLWAVLDPAATDASVSLVITGSGGDWTPSPVTIGAAVAAELATQGVPSKLLTTLIGSYDVPNGGATPFIDVSEYESLYITAEWTGAAANQLGYTFNTGTITSPSTETYSGVLFSGNAGIGQAVNVLGPLLQIINDFAPDVTVTIWGTNRAAGRPPVPPWGAKWVGSAAATGTDVLTLSGGVPTVGPAQCFLYAYPLPSTGTNRVELQLVPALGATTAFPLLRLFDYSAATTGFFIQFETAFPAAQYAPQIQIFNALTQTVNYELHTIPNYT